MLRSADLQYGVRGPFALWWPCGSGHLRAQRRWRSACCLNSLILETINVKTFKVRNPMINCLYLNQRRSRFFFHHIGGTFGWRFWCLARHLYNWCPAFRMLDPSGWILIGFLLSGWVGSVSISPPPCLRVGRAGKRKLGWKEICDDSELKFMWSSCQHAVMMHMRDDDMTHEHVRVQLLCFCLLCWRSWSQRSTFKIIIKPFQTCNLIPISLTCWINSDSQS